MSRIGKKIIEIPAGVSLKVNDSTVEVTGPKGKIPVNLSRGVKADLAGSKLRILSENENQTALKGLNRSLLNNAILGVTNLWSKSLELVGVGFRAQTDGHELTLSLGFSHPVKITAPQDVSFEVKDNKLTISGIDKYLVGEIAAKIRRLKPPEPYKGKGIKYTGEIIRKKAGKAAKALGAATGGK